MRIRTFFSLVASLVLLSGCGGGNKNARLPEVREQSSAASRESDRPAPRPTALGDKDGGDALETGEKKGFLSRIVGGGGVPGYGWDGQHSTVSTSAAVDVVYNRATTALRNLDFVVNSQQSQYKGSSAQLVGVRKSDATQTQIFLATKQSGGTEIKVKVGTLGDRSGSERILDEIQKPRGSAR